MNPPLTTFCDGGTCPSKTNCHRYMTKIPAEDYTRAALWARREAGSNCCDLVSWIKPVSTFKDES